MQTLEVLNQLKELTHQNLPNDAIHEVNGLSFVIHKFEDINSLIVEGQSPEQKEAIVLMADKIAFCLKEFNTVFINTPLFHASKVSDEARLAVMLHEYLHLLYPTLGENTIIEYTDRMLNACGITYSI